MRFRFIVFVAACVSVGGPGARLTVHAQESSTVSVSETAAFRMADVPDGPDAKITIERRGQVVLIGLNRPAIQNRIDPDAMEALARAFFDYDRDNSLRAAVLFGHGSDFSRGIDVDAFKAVAQGGRSLLKGDGFIDPMQKKKPYLTKPLIVAVHGDTWNLAHEIFLSADIRIAAEDTDFGQDENTHGRFPGGGGTVRFPREVGWGNAMRYILTGDHWNARDAYRMGEIQEVVPTAKDALNKAIELANKIAANGPLGVKASLATAHARIDEDEQTAFSGLEAQYRALYKTRDFQEGRDAEAQGRAPVYLGR